MPVTAKFSEEFYDKLGHGIANEIVDWFNQVDLAYKRELKEHNELNFKRFEAVLRAEIAGVEARLDKRINETDAKIEQAKFDIIKWMFLFWSGTALTVIGVMVVLTQ